MLAAFSSLAVSSPGEFGATGNMNGKYEVASGAKQGVKYNDDYASKGYEYFDVWAPEIATHYGEVFWTDQHDQPLPPAIVERFKGKVIALQGYEQDQVCVCVRERARPRKRVTPCERQDQMAAFPVDTGPFSHPPASLSSPPFFICRSW